MTYLRTLILVTISFIFLSIDAHAQEAVAPYGQLYVQDEALPQTGRHRLSFGGGFDSANPLLNVYNVQAGYAYEFAQVIEVGVIAKTFISSETDLKKRVDLEFDLIGLQVEGQKPKWASYLTLSLIPIQGRVNFFARKIIPYALLISAGPGVRHTREGGDLWGWFWSVQNRFYIHDTWAIELNLTQEQEAALSSQTDVTRNQLNLLLVWGF